MTDNTLTPSAGRGQAMSGDGPSMIARSGARTETLWFRATGLAMFVSGYIRPNLFEWRVVIC
jgi:hypothetical protein